MTAYLLHTLKIGLHFTNKEDAKICPRKSVCYDHSQAQPLQTLRHKGHDSFLVEFRNLFAKELPSIMLHRRLQVASDFSDRNYRRVIERIDIRLYSSPSPLCIPHYHQLSLVLWFFSMYRPCVRHLLFFMTGSCEIEVGCKVGEQSERPTALFFLLLPTA